ncbi:MAG: FISUMP domain-containing protein [Candidatus Saccharibacteria bacterium]|nr:FISUMP domain-containing protein [Candidatus Saccharibacteria bacterium]
MSKSVVPNTLIISTLTATLTLLAGAALSSATVRADNAIDDINLTILASCTLSGSGTESHTATTQGNDYIPDIGSTTLHAYCNDNSGFSIYAIGYTDDEYGKTVLTDSSLGSSYDIVTGTATEGATSNWAMKLNLTQDSGDTAGTNAFTLDNGFGSYSSVPSVYTKVAHKNTSTDMTPTTGGVKLTSTYAVFASATQPAGTYIGKVKYTLVQPSNEVPLQPQPAKPGKIVYHSNSGIAVGTIADQTAGDNASVTLYPSNFSRQGYGFAGWSTTFDYSDPTGFYGPNETITTPADTTTNGLSLYAYWVPSAGSIQGWTGCSTLAEGAVTALTDQRDNNTYAVAKLADGNCWMIENLRLDNTAIGNTDGSLAQGYATSAEYGNFSGLADPEEPWAATASYTTANSLYSIDGSNNTINIGSTNAAFRFPRYNNQNTSARATDTTNSQYIYSYGNYYTWSAAIADTNQYNTGDHGSTSICPSGWRLPLGETSTGNIEQGASDPANRVGSFSYLDRKLGGTGANQSATGASLLNWRKYPNNFVFSGYIAGDRGTLGGFWTSTVYSNNWAGNLNFGSSYIYPGTGTSNKYVGRSIRCMLSSN